MKNNSRLHRVTNRYKGYIQVALMCFFVMLQVQKAAAQCTGAEPGPNTGDTSCITLTYMGEEVTYTTVRGADGKIWLQQNLGSTVVAGAVADENAYGDLYQWGRWADGHQKRISATGVAPAPNNPEGLTNTTDYYIIGSSTDSWWSGNLLTDTWTGATIVDASDINGCDPCKALLGQGWQLPTQADWEAIVTAENITNPASAFASSLKLTGNGYRSNTTGGFTYVGTRGYYWSSTTSSTGAKYLYVGTTIANAGAGAPRGQGAGIRCLKAQQVTAVQSVEVAVQGGAQPTITTAGGTLQLTAAVAPSTANQGVTWSIASGNAFASVDANGLVAAIANGTVTIRVTSVQDTTKYDDIEITVAIPEPTYCDAYFINGCADYVYISGVATTGGTTNISNTSTGCSNDNSLAGYANYTAQSVTAAQGNSVGFTMNFNTTSLGTSYLSAWVDWNHDFTFSDNEQVYTSTGEEPNTLNFTVNVPQDAAIGATRIRLKVVNGWIGSGACGYNSFGEVEDYTFNITEVPAVSAVAVTTQNNVPAEITTENGTLQLTATATPSNASQNVTWSITSGSAFATVNANGLVTATANGTVTVRATSVADATKYGELAVVINAEPTCPSLTDLYENFDTLSCCAMGVVPECWESILLGGASQIISSTQPASGTSQIYMNGYGAGKIAIVVLPHFSNVNAGTHQFRFKAKANSEGALDFGYITDTADASTFVVLQNLTISNSNYASTDAERILTVPNTVPANARLALRNPGTTWAGMYWDDVYWEPITVIGVSVATQNNVPAEITTENGTLQLTAMVTPSNASQNVTWSIVSGSEFATVDANGLVTAMANGTVTVRATSVADATKYGELAVVINAEPACPSLTDLYENFDTLSCCAMGVVPECWESILLGGASQIISSTQPASGTSQIYMNGYGAGKIAIVVLPHFSNVNAGTHQFRFKAKANSEGALDFGYITDTADASTFVVLQSLTITNSNYASTDAERILTVPNNVPANARLALRNPGTTWAGIYWDDVYWEPITVIGVSVTTQNNVPAEIITENGTLQLTAMVTPSNAGQNVTWSIVSGSEFATVDANGVVTATANGTVTVRATSVADPTKYGEIEITVNYTIAVESVVVTVENDAEATITTENGTLQLVATVTPDDATNQEVTWSIVLGDAFATVDANGLVTATANGTVTVRATSVSDPAIYDDIEVIIDIEGLGVGDVTKTTFSIYPNPVAGNLTIASDQQINAIKVYNQIGQLIKTGKTNIVDFSGFAQGVYIVEAEFSNGTKAVQKVIKN